MEHPIIVALLAFLMMLTGLSWVGYRVFYKPGKFLRQLGTPVLTDEQGRLVNTGEEPQSSTLVTVLHQIGSYVPTSESESSDLRSCLIQAGFRSEHAGLVFNGVRLVSAGMMFILCVTMIKRMPPNPALVVILIGFGVVVGWILPRMILERKVKSRQEILRLSLPDALDLMVVSVEAGLGLDMAIQHVGRELSLTHPQLSEELSLVNLEMRAGKRRADALRNLAERTGEPEIRKLIAILIQSDRFGTSMGESLRSHSDFLRVRRRQEAEERAGKVGVKLVFPIFFCIMPSIMVVAAGPGLLQIFKYLFPMMKQIH